MEEVQPQTQKKFDWYDIAGQFAEYLYRLGLARNTRRQYLCQVKLYCEEYDPTVESPNVLFANILEFMNKVTEKTKTPTGNKFPAMWAIRHLLVFLKRERMWKKFRADYGKGVKQKPRQITNKALSFDEFLELRNKLRYPFNIVISLQYEGCFRISEVLNLKKRDVRFDADMAQLSVQFKGGKRSVVAIFNPENIAALKKLVLEMARERDDKKVFGRLTSDTVNRVLRAIRPNLTTHWIRHSRAVDVWNRTHDVMKCKTLLRHEHLEMTYQYLKSCGLLEEEVMREVPVTFTKQN